jgi:hypothetical protein
MMMTGCSGGSHVPDFRAVWGGGLLHANLSEKVSGIPDQAAVTV